MKNHIRENENKMEETLNHIPGKIEYNVIAFSIAHKFVKDIHLFIVHR